jgi:predicted ATP-grasp superfamily ATP-dependent carboligase
VDACRGFLPTQVPPAVEACASAIVYADADIARLPPIDWPDWVADRPHAGSRINAGEPLCSVTASGTTADAARRLVDGRVDAILSRVSEKAA